MSVNRTTIMILGGSHSELPLIRASKELGLNVITTGNCESDIGHRHADRYEPADYSDAGIVLELATSLGIDAICAGCNDFSAITASIVAEKLGLPGHDPPETCITLHHKDKFRAMAKMCTLVCPDAVSASTPRDAARALDQIGLPAIVKPVDLTGGKGISVIDARATAEKQILDALAVSRCGRIVIEQFISGTRHGFTAFVENQECIFSFSDDEHYYRNPYLVAGASHPSSLPSNIVETLKAAVNTIAKHLTLSDGILHMQVIYDAPTCYIIEVCRRCPGDLYPDLVQHATGVDYASLLVKSSIAMQDYAIVPNRSISITRHCIMPPANGVLREVAVCDSVKSRIVDSCMWWSPGDRINDFRSHKHGIAFLHHPSHDAMRSTISNLPKLIHVDVDQRSEPCS